MEHQEIQQYSITISTGSVSKIINQSRSDIPDLDLMRQIALMVKKKEIDLNDIVPIIRLKKIIDRFDLSEEKVEEFIEGIKIHCFGKEIKVKEFIPKLDRILNLLANIELPIEEIPEYIEEAQKEKNRLDKEIEKNKKLINKIIERYNFTKDYLERYQADWSLQDTIKKLQQKIEKKDKIIQLLNKRNFVLEKLIELDDRTVLEKELEEANKEFAEDQHEQIEV